MPDEEFMSREEYQELFREWDEDYALRREEGAHPRLARPASGATPEARPTAEPPHPWPSEIASETRQALPDQRPREKSNGHDTGYSM
jgi:hypothetical protein